jgi:S1-C subfamily serine protease
MDGQDIGRRGGTGLLRRFHGRFAVLALIAAVAAAVAAGVAYAKTRPAPVGTGVVVIDTNLAYQGGQAAGTGMVLTSSGEILTNNHVIRGATTIRVVVPGTKRSYTAKVVGYDVSDDVAVLKAGGASNLKTVSTADSSAVKLGQAVKAVGNAGGTGSLVSASGRVTGVTRAIAVSDEQGGSERLTGLIETNAALQPGDSGGPLLNAAGKVIGMDTAASAGYGFRQVASGDGYAIPIDKALTIAKRIESGKASATVHVGGTAFLGVSVAAGYDGSGALVQTVVQGGPADAAGFESGDVITSFAGHTISAPADLSADVLTAKPGARVSVTYADRFGGAETATVTLASGPPQ